MDRVIINGVDIPVVPLAGNRDLSVNPLRVGEVIYWKSGDGGWRNDHYWTTTIKESLSGDQTLRADFEEFNGTGAYSSLRIGLEHVLKYAYIIPTNKEYILKKILDDTFNNRN